MSDVWDVHISDLRTGQCTMFFKCFVICHFNIYLTLFLIGKIVWGTKRCLINSKFIIQQIFVNYLLCAKPLVKRRGYSRGQIDKGDALKLLTICVSLLLLL